MTISRKALPLAAATAALLTFGYAHAHHSYAAFDRCKPVALDGEITSVQWVNPHIVIDLKTQDVASYRIEWMSLIQLERAGLDEALKAGDHVIITGSAMRDPQLKVLSLIAEIRRPSDGWSWQRSRSAPVDCPAG
jgi:hypothetical protein